MRCIVITGDASARHLHNRPFITDGLERQISRPEFRLKATDRLCTRYQTCLFVFHLRYIGTSEEAGKAIAKTLVQRRPAMLRLRICCCSLPCIDASARATTPRVLSFIYKPLHSACRCLAATAAFQHDHILSQIEIINPSRAPLSPSPHNRQTKKRGK